MNPAVTFVVPCYRLAHLLSECVDSILSQTFGDFEILILDDCSPDNTAEVAQSYADPRVKYIRNEVNLGHLRNYNKGIAMARGRYVWLISADDRLRQPYVLERYVALMDLHPEVGFVFCPAVALTEQGEGETLSYSVRGDQDAILNGRDFLSRELLEGDCVVVASAMARAECYAKVTMYPLDLPYAGDWYLWCIFAMHHDVAYLAEPMVHYREHTLSMTNDLKQSNGRVLMEDNFTVLWRVKEHARGLGDSRLVEKCEQLIVSRYLFCIEYHVYGLKTYHMSLKDCEESIQRHAQNQTERGRTYGLVTAQYADELYWQGDYAQALQLYRLSLKHSPRNLDVWVKTLLLWAGRPGIRLRESFLSLRRPPARKSDHGSEKVQPAHESRTEA